MTKLKARSEHEELFAMQLKAARLRGWEREVQLIPGRRWKFDFSHCLYRLICEIEGGIWSGGRHVTGSGFQRDCEKYNAATLKGWRVFRFTAEMVQSGDALRTIEAALTKFGERG
jgi:very-short-patch-repair endonuclease